VRFCTACSLKTEETGRFCPECGHALIDLARAETETSDPPGDSSAARLVGRVIDGQYELQGIIGGGSFGTVYRGRQLGLDRPVAVKVPTHEIASDPVMAKRFAREARSAARIQHPGVVAIYGVGELVDGRPYLVMELVDGAPLDKILESGPIAPDRALKIARSIASALSETHAADVVHRDLKPTNIMWRRDRNGDDRITLVDFGIAVCKPGNADATRLTAGGLIGTPHYMSPEQAHGEAVDARADLYALGCLLHELVTGSPPFDGSGFEVLLAHLGRPAPPPSEKNPAVPASIDHICQELMHKKPDDRPQHANEVVAMIDDALAELVGQGTQAPMPAKKKKKAKPKKTIATVYDLPQRRSSRLAAAFIATAAVAGGAGFAVRELAAPKGEVVQAAEEPAPYDARVGRFRTLDKDNGEMIVQATVPDPLPAGREIGSRLVIKNKLGQPIIADEIVLTIADETGSAKGLTARPSRQVQGRYYFRYTFPKPGRYTLRVFPPSIDSSFEIPVDVL